MTSTSSKLILAFSFLLLFSSVATSYYYNDNQASGFETDYSTDFSIPEYDSQSEIATKLVAPFLFVTILLQIGLQRALMFTLDESNQLESRRDKEEKQLRKQSMILALIIAGMLIPTPFFQILNAYTAIIFGSATIIFLTAIFVGFLLFLIR